MEDYCKKAGLEIINKKIVIPDWVKHIKLDIGLGRFPQYSREWLKKEPNTMIFGFEPAPDALKLVHENWVITKEQMGKSFFAIPIALSNTKEDILDFYVTMPECESSSLLQPTEAFLKHYSLNIKKVEVPTFRLSTFFQFLPDIDYIEYIKIDAQGMDLSILQSGEEYVQHKVVYVTIEADGHQYQNSTSNLSDIDDYMNSIGFVKIQHENTVDPTYYNKKFEKIKDSIYICQKV